MEITKGHFCHLQAQDCFGSDMEEEGFYPFSVKGGLPNEKQFIVTNPVRAKIYLMQFQVSYKEAIVLRVIVKNGICHLLDCIYNSGKFYCTDKNGLNVLKLEADGTIGLTCLNADTKIKSGFGVVAAKNRCLMVKND